MRFELTKFASMNDCDPDPLIEASDALIRRLAIVEVGIPDRSSWKKILDLRGRTGRSSFDAGLSPLVTSSETATRPVGRAVVLDGAAHIREAIELARESVTEPSDGQLLGCDATDRLAVGSSGR